MKKTKLTEEFGFDEFQQRYGESALVMFVIDDHQRLTVCTADDEHNYHAGQTLISLVDDVDEPIVDA